MKTLLTTLALLLLISLIKAQDTSLPQGICRAYLFSGKTIKDMRLWKINNGRVEYLKDENLHDILINEISFIKYKKADYAFSDSAKLYKIEYDVIVMPNSDSINCFIKEISTYRIIYIVPGDEEPKTVLREDIIKYLLKGKEEESPYGQYVSDAPAEKNLTTAIGGDSTSAIKKAAPEEIFPDIDYYQMGRTDGRKEFKGNGSFTGGLFCGIIPVFGWITAPVTLMIPPIINPSKGQLYYTNKRYAEGYRDGAKRKKTNKTIGGFLLGGLMFLALSVL